MSRWHDAMAATSSPVHTFPETVTKRQQARAIKAFTPLQRITTTIKRPWIDMIIAGTKKKEYREIKDYWMQRFSKVRVPFELRMINGMKKNAPEVTVLIKKIDVGFQGKDGGDYTGQVYRLHIAKVLSVKNWPPR